MRSSSPRRPARRRRPTPPARARIRLAGRAAVARRLDPEVVAAAGPGVDDLGADALDHVPTPGEHLPGTRRRPPAGPSRALLAPLTGSSLPLVAPLAPLLVVDVDGTHGRLDDRPVDAGVAIVTGAAKGLGRTYALALAADGWSVVAADVLDLEPLAGEIEATGADVRRSADRRLDEAATRNLADAALARFGRGSTRS